MYIGERKIGNQMNTAFFKQHDDPRLAEVLHLLNPPPNYALWHGGPTILQCVKDIEHEQAIWAPPGRHSIWHFALHITYWKYVVRQRITGTTLSSFSRQPENFPNPPDIPSQLLWKADIDLMATENRLLIETIQQLDPKSLDDEVSGGHRLLDLIMGIVTHDAYHVAQIQLMKRLYQDR
jgi:uncharacterized damage-inducible protein DinB